MLIKMIDGGMVNYKDGTECYAGCPTCDYGSEYINEIWITLTKYNIHAKVNQMYNHALSEGKMMVLFLSNCNEIQAMTEKEFIDWFNVQLDDAICTSDYYYDGRIELFDVTEVE